MTENCVGLVMLTHNDSENLFPGCLNSLFETINYPTVLYFMDLGSTDNSVMLLQEFKKQSIKNLHIIDCIIVQKSGLEDLSKSLNEGFTYLMNRQECELIGWIHPDMVFERHWLSELVSILAFDFEIGKACAFNSKFGGSKPIEECEYFPGQEQAFLIRRGVLLEIGLFDEEYIGIGGYEDWDMNNRILASGWTVMIYPKSRVFHIGMATRARRDTRPEQLHNAARYRIKWGDYSARV